MKVPHTIPDLILRAYTRKQTEEELAIEYKGRLLRSEDPAWDKNLYLDSSLASNCLTRVIKNYPLYVQLVEEWNQVGEKNHAIAFDQWQVDVVNYQERRKSFETKLLAREVELSRRQGEDFDDDDDDEFGALKNIKEPIVVPEEFPDYSPLQPVLDQLSDEHRMKIIEDLDIEVIPLKIAVNTIPDEYYWERACRDRFEDGDPTYNHGGSWKRMYIERHLRDAIEFFHPFEGDWANLNEQLDICGSHAASLVLNNLIPLCYGIPRKAIVPTNFEADEPAGEDEEDEGFNENPWLLKKKEEDKAKKAKAIEEDEEPKVETKVIRDNSHVDLSLILPKLTHLKKLEIVYEMAETGLDWEPRFFDFTMKDCEMLAKALATSPTIEEFTLTRSKMTDEQTKVLVKDGLILMPHLRLLNLSYNNLEDAGAKAIARLVTDDDSRMKHTLRTLILARCRIRNKGAKALSYALTVNNHLAYMDLRLNFIRNSGASYLGHALVENKSLFYLNLAANLFGEPACYVIGKMLYHNNTLRELDLSSNAIGAKGGEYLAFGVRGNRTILHLDIRVANIGHNFEYDIASHTNKNRTRLPVCYLDRDDYYPIDESAILVEDEEEEEEEEEEDEEEDESGQEGSSDDDFDEPKPKPKVNFGLLGNLNVPAPAEADPKELVVIKAPE